MKLYIEFVEVIYFFLLPYVAYKTWSARSKTRSLSASPESVHGICCSVFRMLFILTNIHEKEHNDSLAVENKTTSCTETSSDVRNRHVHVTYYSSTL